MSNLRRNWSRPCIYGALTALVALVLAALYVTTIADLTYPESWPQAHYDMALPSGSEAEAVRTNTEDTHGLEPAVSPPSTATHTPSQHGESAAHKTNKRPRVQIIVYNAGVSLPLLETMLDILPPSVGLAFPAALPDAAEHISSAKHKGHLTFLSLPIQPESYPASDFGPYMIQPNSTASELTAVFQSLKGKVHEDVSGVLILGDTRNMDDSYRRLINRQAEQAGFTVINETPVDKYSAQATLSFAISSLSHQAAFFFEHSIPAALAETPHITVLIPATQLYSLLRI